MIPRLLAPLAVVTLLAANSVHPQGAITLSVASPDGETAVSGTCTIVGRAGERTETYDQKAPFQVVFEGARGLRCRLASEGSIEVTATDPGGNVSRARTSGGTVSLSLSR